MKQSAATLRQQSQQQGQKTQRAHRARLAAIFRGFWYFFGVIKWSGAKAMAEITVLLSS
jgi:hypothetical protein